MQLTKVESECDTHLTWNEQIDTLRRKLLQRIAIFSKSSEMYTNQLSIASLQCKYHCSQTNLDELLKNFKLKLQKRCARLILIFLGMYDLDMIFKSLSGYRLINYSSSLNSTKESY